MLLIGHSLEHAVVDETGEALVEDVAGDPQSRLQVVEAAHAQKRIANDEQTPPLADDFEALGHGAVHVLEAGALHLITVVSSMIERNRFLNADKSATTAQVGQWPRRYIS